MKGGQRERRRCRRRRGRKAERPSSYPLPLPIRPASAFLLSPALPAFKLITLQKRTLFLPTRTLRLSHPGQQNDHVSEITSHTIPHLLAPSRPSASRGKLDADTRRTRSFRPLNPLPTSESDLPLCRGLPILEAQTARHSAGLSLRRYWPGRGVLFFSGKGLGNLGGEPQVIKPHSHAREEESQALAP